VKALLSPLYSRVLEAIVECFITFQKDRELDKWSQRLLDNDADSTGLKALDFLLSQLASMRELVTRHYQYMHEVLSPLSSDGEGYVEEMLLVSPDEFLRWREMEAVYITMEYGYIQRATNDALCETALLEVEAEALVPQALEDIFFLFGRICERALSTGSEHCAFAVGSNIAEMLRGPDGLRGEEGEDEPVQDGELLRRWLRSKDTFKHSFRANRVSTVAIDKVLRRTLLSKMNDPSGGGGGGGVSAAASGKVSRSTIPRVESQSELGAELSAAVEIASGVGDLITQGGGHSLPHSLAPLRSPSLSLYIPPSLYFFLFLSLSLTLSFSLSLSLCLPRSDPVSIRRWHVVRQLRKSLCSAVCERGGRGRRRRGG
jgi:hypothetical protein